MATSFMENLRRPKKLGSWAPTGAINPGESDPYNWAKDLIEREYRDSQFDETPGFSRRGNISRMGARMSTPDWMDSSPNPNGKMNVVYDQRPEMFQKQLNFQKDEANRNQKNIESQRIVDALATNDDYIDRRRQNEMKSRQLDTADFAARNLRPGEMGDREKLQADFNNRHALQSAEAINRWIAERERSASNERVAGMRGDTASDTATTRAAAMEEAARIRANAMTEAARIRAAIGGSATSDEPVSQPTEREIFEQNKAELEALINAPDALRRPKAAETFGANNVPLVSGVGSSALGGSPSSAGLRGNAPIDANATATPYAANRGNTREGMSQVIRKTQRNARTGATRVMISRDGGQTWQPE